MKQIPPIRVISFVLLAACGAWCQSERSSVDLFPRDGSNSPEVQRQEARTWKSLPDAPSSVKPPKQAETFQMFVDGTRLPLTLSAAGINAGVVGEDEPRHVVPGPRPSFAAFHEAGFVQRESNTFLGKYLCPPLDKQNLRYHPLTRGSFVNRATYAASRIFITRDNTGRKRLNTSYFLGVLSSVAAHRASRPYWNRSTAARFNDFGSTIGNDAGLNLFYEFEPGIRQMVKGHAPKFVFRIGARMQRH